MSTMARISQTWFASQIGPMACAISSRWRSAPGARGEQVPDPAAEVGPAQQHVGVERERQQRGHDVGEAELRHRRDARGA